MGVVAGGPHNLGPHYWYGWATAFLLGELVGDAAAAAAVWGIPGNPASKTFGGGVVPCGPFLRYTLLAYQRVPFKSAILLSITNCPTFTSSIAPLHSGDHPNMKHSWRALGTSEEVETSYVSPEVECPMLYGMESC